MRKSVKSLEFDWSGNGQFGDNLPLSWRVTEWNNEMPGQDSR
jgi:hypothetical protein